MSLSLWRRKHPPCEDGHGGATPPSASSSALFPPAYPAYASPPFDRSCPAPPSHTLRLLFRRRVLFDLRACRPPVGLFCNARFLPDHFKSLKHGRTYIRETGKAGMEWERAAKKTRMGFSREQPPSRKPLLAHNPPPQKKLPTAGILEEEVVQGCDTKTPLEMMDAD